MLIVLSPAKSLNMEDAAPVQEATSPVFPAETAELVAILKKKTPEALKELMGISDKLAELNYNRYQHFSDSCTEENSKQALFAFNGDVYAGLQANRLNRREIEFAQHHVRILSGFYGLIRPLDRMQPYRLEMGTVLKNKRGKDLYAFWGSKISRQLNEDAKKAGSPLINLASNEYFRAIDSKSLQVPILHIDFKEKRDGNYKTIGITAKRARGLMTRYIVQNRITEPEGLEGFDWEGYAYSQALSAQNRLVFTRLSGVDKRS